MLVQITPPIGPRNMCDQFTNSPELRQLNRRCFLKSSTLISALGFLNAGLFARSALAAEALTEEERNKMSPDDVFNAAKAGNERFQSGKHAARDALKDQQATASGQHPEAIVLSCIDSRVAPEIVMDLGIGDFFDARVAGNVISGDVLGSMEFACKEEGSKLILVLGHTGCGAIKGAIDNLQLGHLTKLLAKIRPAIRKTVFDGERSSKNPAFVEAVSRTNVLLTIEGIRQQSPVLEELESQRAIKIAGAMYNLATAKIDFMS